MAFSCVQNNKITEFPKVVQEFPLASGEMHNRQSQMPFYCRQSKQILRLPKRVLEISC